ncbi:MAG: hypothetical protein R2821_01465 [Flavobacteriaceae bacterium]|jgi:hypothetical protein|nr:hypothetical protein [Flavobacteriaceae bacterium]
MKNPIFFLATFILYSCSIDFDWSDNVSYYKFTKSDYKYIPTVYKNEGKIFTYRNKDGDEVKIKSLYYTFLQKEYESGYGFGQPGIGDSFYYDELWIELELINFSIECNKIYIHIRKTFEKNLSTIISIPEYDGFFCLSGGFNFTSPYGNLQEINFDRQSYDKVVVINTEEFFTLHNDSKSKSIYYDFKQGIIGFDDLDGKEWRIVN